MGLWSSHVLPRIVDRALGSEQAHDVRARVCAGLTGEVVEIGFGSGLNVPHYPPAVTRVAAVEPSDLAWRLAAPRVSASAVPVQRVGLDGQALPLPDAAFDSALSTWTLCTIPDPVAALREVRRVLRPGGRLLLVEHGLAPEPAVQRWQRRIEPVQKRVGGGCHLTRRVDALLSEAGLTVLRLDRRYLPGEPRPFAALYEGVAAR